MVCFLVIAINLHIPQTGRRQLSTQSVCIRGTCVCVRAAATPAREEVLVHVVLEIATHFHQLTNTHLRQLTHLGLDTRVGW